MLTIYPSRAQNGNRIPNQTSNQPTAQYKTYPPPVKGLIDNDAELYTSSDTASVLENFYPDNKSITPRGGSVIEYLIDGEVGSLFEYRASDDKIYFAADENNIYQYDENTLIGTQLTPVVTGQTSSDYSTVEFENDAGSFIIAVNGSDYMQLFDGTSWQQVTDTSSPISITGVLTNILSHVWAYRNRIFFIEKNSMSAWYLNINAIGGTATKLPLSGVFNKGGALLFGATWSSDSGAGLDDRCVFVTNKGEVAVYTGNDPSNIDSWSLNGVYDIGVPLDKNAHVTIGGDLIVATKAGLIPLSATVQKDVAQLKLYALTRPISTTWQREINNVGNAIKWKLVKWEENNRLFVIPPLIGGARCYVVNLETNAWTKYTGWEMKSAAVLNGWIYFGDTNGNIFKAETGGTDNESTFVCKMRMAYDEMGAIGALKVVNTIRGRWRTAFPINPQHTVNTDYKTIGFPSAPAVAELAGAGESAWDVSAWDVTPWGVNEDTTYIEQRWKTISAQGRSLACQVQITSGAPYRLSCELIAIDLSYNTGGVIA